MSDQSKTPVQAWQYDAALKPIEWSGDMNDDCTAQWAGLTLRAEQMNCTYWWWAVMDTETRGVIADSHSAAARATNGKQARRAAEKATREWVSREADMK